MLRKGFSPAALLEGGYAVQEIVAADCPRGTPAEEQLCENQKSAISAAGSKKKSGGTIAAIVIVLLLVLGGLMYQRHRNKQAQFFREFRAATLQDKSKKKSRGRVTGRGAGQEGNVNAIASETMPAELQVSDGSGQVPEYAEIDNYAGDDDASVEYAAGGHSGPAAAMYSTANEGAAEYAAGGRSGPGATYSHPNGDCDVYVPAGDGGGLSAEIYANDAYGNVPGSTTNA